MYGGSVDLLRTARQVFGRALLPAERRRELADFMKECAILRRAAHPCERAPPPSILGRLVFGVIFQAMPHK